MWISSDFLRLKRKHEFRPAWGASVKQALWTHTSSPSDTTSPPPNSLPKKGVIRTKVSQGYTPSLPPGDPLPGSSQKKPQSLGLRLSRLPQGPTRRPRLRGRGPSFMGTSLGWRQSPEKRAGVTQQAV